MLERTMELPKSKQSKLSTNLRFHQYFLILFLTRKWLSRNRRLYNFRKSDHRSKRSILKLSPFSKAAIRVQTPPEMLKSLTRLMNADRCLSLGLVRHRQATNGVYKCLNSGVKDWTRTRRTPTIYCLPSSSPKSASRGFQKKVNV